MKRRDFWKFTLGLVAGATLLAGSALAAPLSPTPAQTLSVTPAANVQPAVVSQKDVDQLKPTQVRWHHHGHGHHHHWGWHHHGRHHGWHHHRGWHHHHGHRHWHHH